MLQLWHSTHYCLPCSKLGQPKTWTDTVTRNCNLVVRGTTIYFSLIRTLEITVVHLPWTTKKPSDNQKIRKHFQWTTIKSKTLWTTKSCDGQPEIATWLSVGRLCHCCAQRGGLVDFLFLRLTFFAGREERVQCTHPQSHTLFKSLSYPNRLDLKYSCEFA